MDSNKEFKNDKIDSKEATDSSVPTEDSKVKDTGNDLKKYITKVDHRVKTKVNKRRENKKLKFSKKF